MNTQTAAVPARRVLVIDDSRVMRRIIGNMLKELGWEVSQAGNGLEGLDVIAGGSFELCLVDWNMPEMDGLEFVRAVRSDEAYADTKVMFVTAQTDMDRVVEALSAGADEYVMKPFTAEGIRDKLQILGLTED